MATLHQSPVDLESGLGAATGGIDKSSNEEMRVSSSISGSEIVGFVDDKLERGESTVSECSVEVDLAAGGQEAKLHLSKILRDCRICHLSLDVANQESGVPIELGCSCKDDLAAAHKHCAETWFEIKGNKTCEICGSIASNVAVANESEWSLEQGNEPNEASNAAAAPATLSASQDFWRGHRLLNLLLACAVFAFVISWLFHFNVPS